MQNYIRLVDPECDCDKTRRCFTENLLIDDRGTSIISYECIEHSAEPVCIFLKNYFCRKKPIIFVLIQEEHFEGRRINSGPNKNCHYNVYGIDSPLAYKINKKILNSIYICDENNCLSKTNFEDIVDIVLKR